jgi:hypothetical protein
VEVPGKPVGGVSSSPQKMSLSEVGFCFTEWRGGEAGAMHDEKTCCFVPPDAFMAAALGSGDRAAVVRAKQGL